MKRVFSMSVLALLLVLGSSIRNKASAQYGQDRDVSYQTFYDELSPYGRWVQTDENGYVWVPDVEDDFRPYSTNGHWVYTDDYEWLWVSDYDWGWAPFHYGRWEEDDYYGWYWVPGYEWSPAWVAWRDGGDYYGWAPLRPNVSVSINFNIGGYSPPDRYWCFVPRVYITSPRIYDYCLDWRRNTTIIHQTVIINNFNYGGSYGYRCGPRRIDVERYCGRINPVRLRNSYNPGRSYFRGNEVNIYRPNVRREENRNFAPRQFERYDRNNGRFRDGGRGDDNNGRYNNNNDRNFRSGDDGNRRDDNNGNFRRYNDGNRNPGGPDQRDRSNDSPFRRNGMDRRDDGNGRTRDINNPNERPRRDEDQPFRRREDVRRPQDNPNNPNGNNDIYRRRMERNDNPNPNPQPERRVFQPRERREDNPQPVNNERRYERRMDNGGGGQNFPQRQPDRQPRERTDNGGGRQWQPSSQPAERRSETRQFERRDNGGGQQGGGNGGGRGRRF